MILLLLFDKIYPRPCEINYPLAFPQQYSGMCHTTDVCLTLLKMRLHICPFVSKCMSIRVVCNYKNLDH